MMELIVVNNPAQLPWQTNLFDVTLLTIFLSAIAYSVVQLRRNRRIYAVVLTSAFIYGLVLELAVMATLNIYLQGNHLLMFNWTALSLWKGTTMMPIYVVNFYPVILFAGFKVVEGLGIQKRWQAAIVGGLFMIAFDAPYIIEGNLRHVVWWTWDPNFKFFQYWVGWPLVDLCWEGVWDALFVYIMLRALPRIDRTPDSHAPLWSNIKAFAVFAPLAAVAVILGGVLLLAPLTIVTALGGPQWPLVVLLVAGYLVVCVRALRTARPVGRMDTITLTSVLAWVASFALMVIGNVVHEGRVAAYMVVQTVGLLAMCGMLLFPIIAPRRRESVIVPQ